MKIYRPGQSKRKFKKPGFKKQIAINREKPASKEQSDNKLGKVTIIDGFKHIEITPTRAYKPGKVHKYNGMV